MPLRLQSDRIKARFDPRGTRVMVLDSKGADLINTGQVGHGVPTDVAFLAMAYLALDRRDEAEAEFARFNKLIALPEYADALAIGTLRPLLAELNALFE